MGSSSSSQHLPGRITYYPEVDKNCKGKINSSSSILNEETLMFDSRENILRVYCYRVPLLDSKRTCLRLFNRFVVFKTDTWWWSIEKNDKEIVIQRSTEEKAVRNKLLGVTRRGGATLTLEKEGPSNMNVKSLLERLDIANKSSDWNDIFESSSQVFGKHLYEQICLKGKSIAVMKSVEKNSSTQI